MLRRSRAGGWGQVKPLPQSCSWKNEVQKQLQTSQIFDKHESMPRSQMQTICLEGHSSRGNSTEDGRGQSFDLCFNFVIQLLVVFMLPHHHHQTASLNAHGSSQVLPEDGKLEYLYNKNSFSNIKCQFQQHSVSRSLSCARYTWMVCKHMATPSPRTLQACGTLPNGQH